MTEAQTTVTVEMLYVVGWTWGYLDEGGHALNGFGRFGGRDVVLLKLTLDGDKLWTRQARQRIELLPVSNHSILNKSDCVSCVVCIRTVRHHR